MSPDELFVGGGSSGRLMAALDWAATPLGPVESWPQSLRAAVRIVLSSRYPMLLLWGPEFTQLYNDAYSALIGDRHPAALGGDVRVTLAEGWDVLEPLIADAMATGVASWVPALQLLLNRAGYREEAYFSVSHAAARDDDGRTVGVLTVCSEVTETVVGERRLSLLRDLALQGDAQDVARTCTRLTQSIAGHPLDVPFAAIYLREGAALHRVTHTGVDTGALPQVVADGEPDPWGLSVAAGGVLTTVAVPGPPVPAGPWGDPVQRAVALPLPSADPRRPAGVLLAAVSPSRALDDGYRSFFGLLAQQVSTAVRNTQAYLEERRRAEELARLDRAKTTFFTNVSHEFRTPLTLMLGPLADALADREEPLGPAQRERVDTAQRNATRLLTLVNDLMTFSSLEAGRAGNNPREVDLATLTADLAGVFRAAVERAAVRLVVDCPPLPRPVAVDPGNWEKIVTNLMSNALKFTFVGQIRVALESDAGEVRLLVQDTGIGIDPDELPRLFDRFHRVQGVRSRSHEGTGIGLALVRELSRLMGGDVRVDSAPGRGTAFTVSLPWGAVELSGASPGLAGASPGSGGASPGPAGASPGSGEASPGSGGASGQTARAAVREVLGWLGGPDDPPPADAPGARILVADDNADMRAYLSRLLGTQGWAVETAADGQAALAAIRRHRPDLLLTDVMMPQVDGFELVRELRADERTRTLPIIVLSARAGQDAGVEGLHAGADDYVVKPFTAAELIARVRGTLELARIRGDTVSLTAGSTAVTGSGRAPGDAAGTDNGRAAAERAAVAHGDEPAQHRRPVNAGRRPVAEAPRTDVPVADAPRTDAPRTDAPRAAVPDDVDKCWTYPLTPTASAAMRRDLRATLKGAVDPDLLDDLQVAATEAVNNAVEHAQHPSRPEVEVRLRVADGTVRVAVQDFGTWRGRAAPMDRGRGALLMNAYGEVRVVSTATGTLVTIERRLT